MKYIVVLVDGMADEPMAVLEGKTPLEVANIPWMHYMATKGEIGLVHTIPEGMSPGSDTANLSVMGYDPQRYHTGRSPLEAASIGVKLKDTDVTFRMNFVTLSNEANYEDRMIIDHSAGEVTTEEACELLKSIISHFSTESLHFYYGTSYRHLLLWDFGLEGFELTPPHDILARPIKAYLPKGQGVKPIADMMAASYDVLKDHPINIKRMAEGLRPANAIWIWGEGKKPQLDAFSEKFGIMGSVISAVDLIKGIGLLAGLKSIDVVGATGNLHTNYAGKMEAAYEALLGGDDFCYIHIEAPDECGHQGDLQGKIKSIENIDAFIVGPLLHKLAAAGEDFRMLVLPDHPTPIHLRTHTSAPVPFVLYDSTCPKNNPQYAFTEIAALESKHRVDAGHEMMSILLEKKV